MDATDCHTGENEMPVRQLRLAKQFYSLQGEGELSGVPMYFVRLAGCSVASCPLHPSGGGACDTDWGYRNTESTVAISEHAISSKAHWVCVTGGEPTDQMEAINDLAGRVHKNHQRTMIQTSGVRQLVDCWDWIVVSPKSHFTQLAQTDGHEMKLVWNGEDFDYLRDLWEQTHFLRYYLQPLCLLDGTTNIKQVAETVKACGELGLPWRLGIQQHKLWGGD